ARGAGFRPTLPPARPPRHRYRLGILKGADENIHSQVAANFRAALDVLKDAIDVVEGVELPDFPYGIVGGTIIAAEGSSAFDDLFQSGRLSDLTAPEDRSGGYPALAIPARDSLRPPR